MLPKWKGMAVVCIASGPSLTDADVALVRRSGLPTVVTNTTFRRVPWADVLMAHDAPWFKRYLREVRQVFQGRIFCQSAHFLARDIESARCNPRFRSFGNSGANGVALAVCSGAARIILVAFDCQFTDGKTHHHGDHPDGLRNCDSLPKWPRQFERLSRYAAHMGATVVNASRASALTCFPRVSLESEIEPWLTI